MQGWAIIHGPRVTRGRANHFPQRGLPMEGLPYFGERIFFAGGAVAIEAGRLSLGSLRESENAPLAERSFP